MNDHKSKPAAGQYITVRVHDQLFGLPIAAINEVFVPEQITRVKLAPREVAGVLNLRGRIATMIEMRALLGFPPREAGSLVAAGTFAGGAGIISFPSGVILSSGNVANVV